MTENVTLNKNTGDFYRNLLKVAIPVMLQQLIIVAVGLCDTIMVGKISEEALAAVGAANQVFIVYIDCMFGFLSGVSVFAVQYWGIRDLTSLRKLLGIGYSVVIAVGAPVTAFVYFMAPQLIDIFSNDPQVIAIGTEYLRIAVFTYLIGAITFVVSFNSRVIAKLTWPTVFNGVAVALNIFLNWCLIFGKLGFPEMGVKGAALATLIARIVEVILMVGYTRVIKSHPLHASLREMKYDAALFKRVVKTAFPVVVNEFLWVISFTSIFAIYGRISAAALAVVQVAMTITDIFQAVFMGLGNGCNVIVGQTLGRGDRELAFTYAKRCINIAWVLIGITTVLFIVSRSWIVSIYDFKDETNLLLSRTLLVYALAIAPRMLAYLQICGILRSGGDTIWSAVADAGVNWIVEVPLALISVSVLNWSLPYCVALVALGDLLKTVICYIRIYSKKWINVFTGR